MSKYDGKNKAQPKSLQDEVDDLITWYEKFKPDAGQQLVINCVEADLNKFETLGTDDNYWYRGRHLVPVKQKTQSAKRFQEEHQVKL